MQLHNFQVLFTVFIAQQAQLKQLRCLQYLLFNMNQIVQLLLALSYQVPVAAAEED